MIFLEKLLNAYNLTYDDYLLLTKEPSLDDIEDPLNFLNIQKGVNRIFDAIKNKEKIMIYGDYDSDGICSVSILVNAFKKMNYQVGYYIPSRYKDGYGINDEMVELIHQKGYKVIITVDNGVSQHSALTKAKEYGIDVILTDHHEILNDVPPCYCIIHPFMKSKDVLPQCGAYVAFMLSILLLGEKDPYLLTLASLATISDMMPLVGYNRVLVRNAIKILNEYKFPQFKILLDNNPYIDEKSLSFVLAPKINAIGRVNEDNSVNKVVKYFTTNDYQERILLADYINSINDQRKSLCNEAYNNLHLKESNELVVCEYIPSLKEGLIGLVAAKVLNEKKRPTIIFTKSVDGFIKGSGRSLEGFSLASSFNELKHLIEVYGGHSLAGGLTIKESNFELFKNEINKLAIGKEIKEKRKLIIEVDLDELNYHNYSLIRSLSPFGEGFEEVYLKVKYPVKNISFIGNIKQHFKGFISPKCSFIHFNGNKDLLNREYVDLIGKIEEDKYRGNDNISFVVSDIE